MHAVYLGTYSNRVTVISKALGRCDSQWRINHDANDAMAWGPPLKGAPRAAV